MPTGYVLSFWNGWIRNAGANKTHRDFSLILTKGCYMVKEWFIPTIDKLIPWMAVCGDEGRKGKGSDLWETDRLGWISSSIFHLCIHLSIIPFRHVLPLAITNHKLVHIQPPSDAPAVSIHFLTCILRFKLSRIHLYIYLNTEHLSAPSVCISKQACHFLQGYDWLYPEQIFRLKPLGQGRAIQ